MKFSGKVLDFSNIEGICRFFTIPNIILFMFLLISGCTLTREVQTYSNPELCITLERPNNWEVAYFKRSGLIVLEAKSGFLNKNSARLEIQGNSCLSTPDWMERSSDIVEYNIARIQNLYFLDAVTVIQQPLRTNVGDYEIVKAVIEIPTRVMVDDLRRIQVNERDNDTKQTIAIFVITDHSYGIVAMVYEGDDVKLNNQALAIINSIKITATTEP